MRLKTICRIILLALLFGLVISILALGASILGGWWKSLGLMAAISVGGGAFIYLLAGADLGAEEEKDN